ncbi:hypothetical protein IBX65_09265, partial [Candidatus Aerophobetes bacterium]|nr:hypothetical protein [Candidatus Aerophobetes bacterium]
RFLTGISERMDEQREFLLISQLSGEVVEFLEFADMIRRHHQLSLIQPTEPWREAKGLEQAYRWYERVKRMEEILTRHSVRLIR